MPRAVVGRTGELRLIERFLEALSAGPQVLVLRGEAGIGKTTLLRAAIDQARERGVRVLACTAVAAEARLSYMGLGDLFADVRVDERPRLPAPQRGALDAALLRSGRTAADADPRAVATATLSVLESLADERPVLVAIDDAQWLDSPTAAVAEFCARRHSGRVGLLATQRVGEGTDWPARLARRLAPERIELHRLGPLHPDEVALMLRDRAGDSLDRRTLLRIQEAAGGNPFYAVELARAVPREGSAGLSLPDSLDEILAARLGGLAPGTDEALLAVACLAQPTVDVLERALGRLVVSVLDEAEEREIVQRDGRTLRFAHPLLAAGVYARAPAPGRRAMHARLSGAVDDVEQRARHLA
ncbi:MAG: AAA family ATPase, partial [Solirubrobacteraceae bacterium]